MTTTGRREEISKEEALAAAAYRKFYLAGDFPEWLERFKAARGAEEAIGLLHRLFDAKPVGLVEGLEKVWFLIGLLSPGNASSCKDRAWIKIREKAVSVVVGRLLKKEDGYREPLAIRILQFNHGATQDFVRMLIAYDPDSRTTPFGYQPNRSSEKVVSAFLETLAQIFRGSLSDCSGNEFLATMRGELSEIRVELFTAFLEHRLDHLCRLDTRSAPMRMLLSEKTEELRLDAAALYKIVSPQGEDNETARIEAAVASGSRDSIIARAAELFLAVSAQIRALESMQG
jgi:hypothetical protein